MAPAPAPEQPPVVLVTGCSQNGIGYELCRAFAARGCRVFATARRLAAMRGLPELGVEVLELDVTRHESVKAAVAAVAAAAARIDILVNCAGVVTLGPSAEVPIDVVRQSFDVNVFGLLAMVQAVVPHMAAQGRGRIINIGSLTGLSPVPLRGIYSATKGAVLRLTDALRLELGLLGVQVMLVAPGFIQSQARDTAKGLASGYCGGSMWGSWLPLLERAMEKLLANAVPADAYAAALVDVALRPKLPSCWVGPCAGSEWVVRWLPGWLQDRMLTRAFGLDQLRRPAGGQGPSAAAGRQAGDGPRDKLL